MCSLDQMNRAFNVEIDAAKTNQRLRPAKSWPGIIHEH